MALLDKLPHPKVIQQRLFTPREFLKALPLVTAKPIAYSPFLIQKMVATKLLLRLFRQNLNEGDLDFLKDKWLKLEVADVDFSLQFSCAQNRDVLVRKNGLSDVSIRGDFKSFVLLAARKEDPDTLFFQRDLVIEGDTDLGLEVKNLMDSFELDVLPPELTFLVRSGAEYMDAFC